MSLCRRDPYATSESDADRNSTTWPVALRCCGGVNVLLDGGEEPAETRRDRLLEEDCGLQNAIRLCRFPGGIKWMLLNHQTGLVLYVHTGNRRGKTSSVSFTVLRFPKYSESDMGECSLKGGCICPNAS
jgi:hypothetical protein